MSQALTLRAAALGILLGGLWLASVLYFVGQASRAENARFSMDRVKHLELEARRSEKNFLLRSIYDENFHATGTSDYLKFHRLAITGLRAEVLRLSLLLPESEQKEIHNLARLVDAYDAAFNELVAMYRRQGFGEWGLAGEWERVASQLQQTFNQNGDLQSAKLLLQVRHAEKKYLWRGDADCLQVHADSVALLRKHLRGSPARARLLPHFEAYEQAFAEYLDNEKRIGRTRFEGLQGEYQRAIDAVEPAVEKLEQRAITAHQKATVRQYAAIVAASILMAVLLGAVLLYARAAHAGQRQLRTVNEKLEAEIAERRRAEGGLQEAHDQLDQRVKERTAQLAQVNQALELELAERQKLEAQLMQSHKMEAVGRLAGGIAHDFNNLLMIISGHTELLLENTNLPHSGVKSATRIQEAAQRAAALTKQLLAFSRKQVLQARVVDLNSVVAEIEHMLRRLIGEHIELSSELAPDLGRVKADPGQVEQVIMNLAVNARDAMPRGGKLMVRTANFDVDKGYARRHPGMRPGCYVMLEVSDTGMGMDPETQLHIFEPFFTTKEKGRGTGLGLATTYGIVKQSNGYIAVESSPGMGTTFRIFLPRVEELADTGRPSAGDADGEIPLGSETVLVVEDEEPLRLLAREFLEKSGYRVLDAGNGPAALEISRNYPGPIHLLLSDVIMPGMSGPDLAAKLKISRPETLVLFASGYTDDELAGHGFNDAATAFLPKPFTREAVSRKVRDLLDRVSLPR
jgi:signal transduction histidine kinase